MLKNKKNVIFFNLINRWNTQNKKKQKKLFTDCSDNDLDYEINDQYLNKSLIVTQTPPYIRKHPGGNRPGNHMSLAKITCQLAEVINNGLYYYKQYL